MQADGWACTCEPSQACTYELSEACRRQPSQACTCEPSQACTCEPSQACACEPSEGPSLGVQGGQPAAPVRPPAEKASPHRSQARKRSSHNSRVLRRSCRSGAGQRTTERRRREAAGHMAVHRSLFLRPSDHPLLTAALVACGARCTCLPAGIAKPKKHTTRTPPRLHCRPISAASCSGPLLHRSAPLHRRLETRASRPGWRQGVQSVASRLPAASVKARSNALCSRTAGATTLLCVGGVCRRDAGQHPRTPAPPASAISSTRSACTVLGAAVPCCSRPQSRSAPAP